MKGIAKGMATIFGRMMKPAVNDGYPGRKRVLPERARMSFGMNRDEGGGAQCKACMLCERSCPDNAIVLETEKRTDGPGRVLTKFTIDLGKCMYCGLCVEQCTSDGLHHTGEYENCSAVREDMMLVLYDAALEGPSPMRDSTPEELTEVAETFGVVTQAEEGEGRVMTAAVLFYFYAFIAVAGAVGLVNARKLLHGVMSLFATLVAMAGLYLLLGMEFLAAMQLFVYGGAITVLVLFALMLSGPRAEAVERISPALRWTSALVCAVFFVAVAAIVWRTTWTLSPTHVHDTASIASILFSRYVLPFEIAGLSLTIALIGAVVIAREDDVKGLTAETATDTTEGEVGA